MLNKILSSVFFLVSFCLSFYSNEVNAQYLKGRNMHTDFALISTIVGNPSFIRDATGADYFDSRRDAGQSDHCIFSYKNHFYWKTDGKIFDSYRMKWQRTGSANLCQTYAQMGYSADVAGLRSGSDSYLDNARVALSYWQDHAQLIIDYWDGTVEVIGDDPGYSYEYSVFSGCKKPTLANLRNMIRIMGSSDDHLLHLMTTEQIE